MLLAQINLSWTVPIVGSVTYVAGISLVVPSLVALLARYASNERAAAIAFNTFLLFVGAALAPLLIGHLPYRPALAILAAALLTAACVIAVGLPRPSGREHRMRTGRSGQQQPVTEVGSSESGVSVNAR